MGKLIDLTGRRFGRLVVIKRDKNSKSGRARWLCLCDCGKFSTVTTSDLLNSHTRSCGCLWKESIKESVITHNDSNTRLYRIYKSILFRTHNKNCNRFLDYGGRGIDVCSEWEQSYIAFKQWALSNGYEDNLTIDRIDNSVNY